uniref:Uncharacterized protein n=1 Tax=Setaria viridis TaxID=4556 RepID=A0A4U6T4R2_SETVI|nr:hypothetical protein SEVIR_9G376500v2 [Setaria viridis]
MLVALDFVSSKKVFPDSMEDGLKQDSTVFAGTMEMTSDSFVPDSLLPESHPSLCVRCGTSHTDNDDEGCFQACRRTRRCARCGLLHSDYNIAARILHDIEKFDCETYISDMEKLQMDGDTILVHEHIMKKLDKQLKMKQDASMEIATVDGAMEDAKKDQ